MTTNNGAAINGEIGRGGDRAVDRKADARIDNGGTGVGVVAAEDNIAVGAAIEGIDKGDRTRTANGAG